MNLSFDGLGDVADTLSVSEEGFIESVRIKLYATHTRPKGLSVALISPAGTRSVLLTPLNGYMRWDATDYLELSSNAFYGESIRAIGNWRLKTTCPEMAANSIDGALKSMDIKTILLFFFAVLGLRILRHLSTVGTA